MSNKSNNQGRAYEFSYLITLFEEISKIRLAKIEKIVVTLRQKERGIL